MDYGRIVRMALVEWWKQKNLQKLAGALFVLQAVFGLLVLGLGMFVGLFVLYIIAIVMLSAYVGRETLSWRQTKPVAMTNKKALKLILFEIYLSLVVFFLWKDKKWLAVPIASLVLLVLGIVLLVNQNLLAGGALLVLAILGFLFYFLLLMYHSYRLIFAGINWIQGNVPMGRAVDDSWQFTKGNVIEIFVAMLIVGIVIGIVVFAVSLVASLFGIAGSLTSNPSLILGGQGISMVISALVTAFAVGAGWAAQVEIFLQLTKTVKKTPSKTLKQ